MNQTKSRLPQPPKKLLKELENTFGQFFEALNQDGYRWLLAAICKSLDPTFVGMSNNYTILDTPDSSKIVSQGHIFAFDIWQNGWDTFNPEKMLYKKPENLLCITQTVPNCWEYLALAAILARLLQDSDSFFKKCPFLGGTYPSSFIGENCPNSWLKAASQWPMSATKSIITVEKALQCLRILADPYSWTESEFWVEEILFGTMTEKLQNFPKLRFQIIEKLCIELLVGCWATIPPSDFEELSRHMNNKKSMWDWSNDVFDLHSHSKALWFAWQGLQLLTVSQMKRIENWSPFAMTEESDAIAQLASDAEFAVYSILRTLKPFFFADKAYQN